MSELNRTLGHPETYGMPAEQIIKIQSHKIEKLEVEVYQAVTERDRLRQAYIFRHFEVFVVYGFLAFLLLMMLVFGPGL
jgi:hypothetical protein